MKRSTRPGEIKVGVIGYGGAFNMGRYHLTEMKQAGMVPTAVAELDPKRLAVARQDFPGIETYGSTAELLAQSAVSLLAIITPHNTHAPLALQCLRAGRHVVVEKPMAITTAQCDAMIRAARANRVVLSTYHNRHWDGIILQAVDQVRRRKAIGEVVRVEIAMGGWGKPGDWWRTSKSISGGILFDWGVHLLEYTLQLVAADVAEVTGFSRRGIWAPQTPWKTDTNEDDAFVAVRYASGAWSTLSITTIDARPPRDWFKVTGTKGQYTATWEAGELVTHAGDQTITTRIPNPPSQSLRFYQNIADHLTQGVPLVITPEWARRPIHILDLACQSAKQGRALRPKYR